jgi:protein-S-isoprenylcysteine O-methyltransferase Ste14
MKELSLDMSILIFLLYALWLGSEIALSRIKLAGPADRKLDSSSLRILWITITLSITAGVFFGLGNVGQFGNRSPVFPAAGTVLILLGLVIRWVAILSLKQQFTVDVAITAGHRLVREGIYGIVRHPSYAGGLISFLGLGISFSNYISLIVIFVPICAAFVHRIKVEEKVLMEAFGNEYARYCATTKRLIPGIY